MMLFETNNRNLVIAVIIVICSGVMVPFLNFGINLGIVIQVLQYLAMWVAITLIPVLLLHYAPVRTEFQFKKFAIYTGFCFIPLLIRNILVPLIGSTLTTHLDGVWDIDVIRQSTGSWVFQAKVFLYTAIPIIALCLVIIFVGISMNRVYDIAIEKALLISTPIIFIGFYVLLMVGKYIVLWL